MADVKKTAKTKAPAKKVTKASEVKTLEQLKAELVSLQNEHRESRRGHQMGELVNPHVLTTQRKAIARVHTAIKLAELAAAKEEN